MTVTFLAHSGFLVESTSALLLFDWWKGDLPPLADKPLVCFASHSHPDHFDPRIFTLDRPDRPVTYILARDIRITPRNLERWHVSAETAGHCISLRKGEHISLPGLEVETLHSTDAGVAFVVTVDGAVIYHAGDLNWWHWEGEDQGWNRNMETNFKRYLEPLRGRKLSLAFAPLDPRQGDSYDWGVQYLLEMADVRHLFPMHQWEDFSPTARFCQAHPQWAGRIVPVERLGQQWSFGAEEL